LALSSVSFTEVELGSTGAAASTTGTTAGAAGATASTTGADSALTFLARGLVAGASTTGAAATGFSADFDVLTILASIQYIMFCL